MHAKCMRAAILLLLLPPAKDTLECRQRKRLARLWRPERSGTETETETEREFKELQQQQQRPLENSTAQKHTFFLRGTDWLWPAHPVPELMPQFAIRTSVI